MNRNPILAPAAKAGAAFWTESRVSVLKAGCLAGDSFEDIAREIGEGCTRHKARGKAIRLGLERAKAPPKRSHRSSGGARGPRFEVAFIADYQEPPGSTTILSVGPHMCRWPIGDPRSDAFTLCGEHAGSRPYCDRHTSRAYDRVSLEELLAESLPAVARPKRTRAA